MVKIIAIVSWKGGTGKTHTAVNLAGALATKGKKVAVIDNDGQSNLTFEFGMHREVETILDTFREKRADLPVYQYDRTRVRSEIPDKVAEFMNNIYVVPCNQAMESVTTYLRAEESRGRTMHFVLRDAILNTPLLQQMDYIIIDNPPNIKSPEVTNALMACHDVIIPVESDGMSSLQNIANVYTEVNSCIMYNQEISVMGILQTKFANNSASEYIAGRIDKLVKKTNNIFLKSKIRYNAPNMISRINSIPVCMESPKSPAAQDFNDLSFEVSEYYKGKADRHYDYQAVVNALFEERELEKEREKEAKEKEKELKSKGKEKPTLAKKA